jgi:CheY-like chemotaxis protein
MTRQILYVEDHFNNMLLVKRIVEAEGHHFLTAADGESGWTLALEHRPDLIFVDLRLPGTVDGFELLQRLKSDPWLSGIPAVVLTAYGEGDVEARATEAGCDGFLHKPADILQVRSVIRKYVGSEASQTYQGKQGRMQFAGIHHS